MYVTVQPCNQCLLALIQAGIKNVYYITEYDKSNYFEDYNKYINNFRLSIVLFNKE